MSSQHIDRRHIEPTQHEFPAKVYYSAKRALTTHASGGNVLIGATILALIVANIPGINTLYADFWDQEIRLQVGSFNIFSHGGHPMSMLQFINDALMAIFFFSIGLEIKREVLVGELSSFKQALLPIVAAIGGMVVPVGIFWAMASGTDYIDGAAIPMATDIAFSLGILAMLGSRVPLSLKIFLTTLAVVDDIGGIIVIAAFYSTHIEPWFIVGGIAALGLLFLGSRLSIQSKIFYIGIGTVVWYLFLNSGIHPTIAGVLIAFCIPARPVFAPKKYVRQIRTAIAHFNTEDDETLSRRSILDKDQMDWLKEIESASDKVISPLQDLEDSLHPVVSFLIVPLFAFANAGIGFAGLSADAFFSGISLAIIVALVAGKFLGIFAFSWLTVKTRLAPMPAQSDWRMIAAVAMLGGIGFTVSLFIANLSFGGGVETGNALLNNAKIGIVAGSLLAGVVGFLMLHRFLPKSPAE
ncbi:Na+/H+ antiporter NhaA [uncultured Muribaculum sp.]|uniref:Na+/H+ antiporter NhaA n=1 Tax=uncultured Muribaculum sp. TaxID=1918613 RepID=UPI0025F37DEF|nr:Na+/H+ antiporter NhaA [uncultured Muribaculum sp.]